jgi:hypothetical protein
VATLAAKPASRSRWRYFFPGITSLLLVLSLIAFSDNLVTDVGQPSNRTPRLIIHGLFGLGWSVVLVLQAWLVLMRRTARHRAIGALLFLIGAGLVVSTAFLFITTFRGFSAMSAEVVINRLLLPVFAFCLWQAWRERKRPDFHKRYLLIGSFAMLSPVLSRDFNHLFWPWYPDPEGAEADTAFLIFYFATWSGLIGSLWFYDRTTLGRIHRVTWIGSLAIAVIVVGATVLIPPG